MAGQASGWLHNTGTGTDNMAGPMCSRMTGIVPMIIREDDLTDLRIVALLGEHLEHMHSITPAESVHALDIDELRGADVTFWSAWEEDELLGCGALQALDAASGEIKSMRTVVRWQGRGVGSAILDRILAEARQRRYRRLYLETGSMAEFAPARALYERYGFRYREPFGDYVEDPNSVFMTKAL